VNPLLSLADPEVYSIPMLLVIGWRGEPGVKDEPQHVKQGRRMTELLDAMEVPWFLLPSTIEQAGGVIAEAGRAMRNRVGPVAILVRAGTFERYDLKRDVVTDFPMNREDAVKCITGQLQEEDLIVATTGKTSRELYEYRQAKGTGGRDFLTVGGMGHTASIAMGIARVRPERLVVCLDGDGSVIMHMGALGVIAKAGLTNLLHVVINNGAHDSVGGQPTVGYDIDLPGIAIACGYRDAVSVSEPHELEKQLARLRGQKGPVLLEVRVNKGARADLGRPKSTPLANREALMSQLGL
jgi:phosphonopyruvate decarboxylase